MEYESLLNEFVSQSKEIFAGHLTGIYLHGSAVMGCFNPEKSDLDLLVVIKEDIPDETKRRFMDMVVVLNERAPSKGLELSVVKEDVCNPFVYPTPFELHFSNTHLQWYQNIPQDYVKKMKGIDKDLAAHFTIIYHRGKVLYGKEIFEVFAPIPREAYLDSIWCDIENAVEEVAENPMYLTLNLCRVLAYKRDGLIVSKQEGGEWGIRNILQPEFQELIGAALREYQSNAAMIFDVSVTREYASYILREIKKNE